MDISSQLQTPIILGKKYPVAHYIRSLGRSQSQYEYADKKKNPNPCTWKSSSSYPIQLSGTPRLTT
jgi:hypothetical protein